MVLALRIAGIIVMAMGTIGGAVMVASTRADSLGAVAILSGIISGLFLLGFGEVIRLLQKITFESKIAVEEKTLVADGKGGFIWAKPDNQDSDVPSTH